MDKDNLVLFILAVFVGLCWLLFLLIIGVHIRLAGIFSLIICGIAYSYLDRIHRGKLFR
jgi:hypothetical protein